MVGTTLLPQRAHPCLQERAISKDARLQIRLRPPDVSEFLALCNYVSQVTFRVQDLPSHEFEEEWAAMQLAAAHTGTNRHQIHAGQQFIPRKKSKAWHKNQTGWATVDEIDRRIAALVRLNRLAIP